MPEWVFPISPVAASRPRVGRHGGYFTGPYKKFREECRDLVPMVLGPDFSAYDRPLYVDLECYITKPKTTKLTMPRGDIDNYQKAVFDAMNDNLWTDDKLIQAVYAVKQWSDRPQGYFVIGVNYAEEYEI